MRAIVSKWGNSLGIRIPRGVAEDARVAEGSAVDVRVEEGCIVIEPLGSERLTTLLARITADNRHGEQLADAPMGREAP
jgi:antitoxin MazE